VLQRVLFSARFLMVAPALLLSFVYIVTEIAPWNCFGSFSSRKTYLSPAGISAAMMT